MSSSAKAKPSSEEQEATAQLHGSDIGQMLSSQGPTVQCVLLRHMRQDGKDGKPHAVRETRRDGHPHERKVLEELIEQVAVDTTPSSNGVANLLGGPFTFVGQFPTEGTVVMARREYPDDWKKQSIKTLRSMCQDMNIETKGMVEKSEMIKALEEVGPPDVVNPHQLQPPLDGIVVKGDLLIMKVAETPEELDGDEPDMEALQVPSNEEFFLDYTKEEYVAFASRTDVVAPEPEDDEEAEAESEGDDDDDDDDYDDDDDDEYKLGQDEGEDVDDDFKKATLNMILNGCISKFREENGRGPDTKELLELRREVAQNLGVEVFTVEDVEEEDKKRATEDTSHSMPSKKVKFTSPADKDGDVSDGDKKPPAKPAL